MIRAGIVCDHLEERWPSMDLSAEMTLAHLAKRDGVWAERIRPEWRGGRLPRNVARILNRYLCYHGHIRSLARSGRLDLFHLIDHSYSQLVHAIPPGRAVVTCHDLDTFRCLLDPAAEPRPRWFRAMVRRTLKGFESAAAIACVSEATRAAILGHGLAPKDRIRVIPNGVSPEFLAPPSPGDDRAAEEVLGPVRPGAPEFLHVGSNIPRKRIDVLLDVFARIKDEIPDARLVKIGGRLTPEQQDRADRLNVTPSATFFPYIEPDRRGVIAAAYRRASVVLMPSEAEGFGLPVAEALACGAAVLASDLPVLREVGGDAASYRPVGDVSAWACAAIEIALRPREDSSARRARAARFTWDAHARDLVEMYGDVLAGRPAGRGPNA